MFFAQEFCRQVTVIARIFSELWTRWKLLETLVYFFPGIQPAARSSPGPTAEFQEWYFNYLYWVIIVVNHKASHYGRLTCDRWCVESLLHATTLQPKKILPFPGSDRFRHCHRFTLLNARPIRPNLKFSHKTWTTSNKRRKKWCRSVISYGLGHSKTLLHTYKIFLLHNSEPSGTGQSFRLLLSSQSILRGSLASGALAMVTSFCGRWPIGWRSDRSPVHRTGLKRENEISRHIQYQIDYR